MEHSKTQEEPQAKGGEGTEDIGDDPLRWAIRGEHKGRVGKPCEHEEPGERDREPIDGSGDEESDADGVEEDGHLEEVGGMSVDGDDVLGRFWPTTKTDVLGRNDSSATARDANEPEAHPDKKDEKGKGEHRCEDGVVTH